MLLHSFRCCSYNVVASFGILLLLKTRHGKCNPITNSNLNEHIREFAPKENGINSTNVKTLQEDNPKRYTDLVSFRPISFKIILALTVACENISQLLCPTFLITCGSGNVSQDVPDSKQSSSSYHEQGLVSREHPGYSLHDYEEYPHVNYGYNYHLPDAPHHGLDHHNLNHGHYDGHHHLGHHRYYNYALAAKAVLWPIAGIALLGAAAALVSNPILLQLGVASGKRRRRNTEEITGPESSTEITEWRPLINRKIIATKTRPHSKADSTKLVHKKATQLIKYKRNPTTETPVEVSELNLL